MRAIAALRDHRLEKVHVTNTLQKKVRSRNCVKIACVMRITESHDNQLLRNKRILDAASALVDLARTRIAFMVVISCAVGYVLAYKDPFDYVRFISAMLGTGLLSSGGCAINCYIERDLDAIMPRTAQRPIPAGVISPAAALIYGLSLIISGALILFVFSNLTCTALGLSAVAIYLGMYTPAKRWTWLNTTIGAVPGAIPPLIGWAAAAGEVAPGGWLLFAMLFVWQHTHFLPIAWIYKEDYRSAGFQMLTTIDESSDRTHALTIATAVILLPLSAMLYWTGHSIAGPSYGIATLLGGLTLVVTSVQWRRNPSRKAARMVLLMSVLYLPAIFAAVVIDRVCGWT